MKETKVFIVEDDLVYAKVLENKLKDDLSLDIEIYTTGLEVLKNLYKKPSIITLDYKLPDISAEELLNNILVKDKDISVVVVSGQDDIQTAVSLVKEGAYDYVTKDANAIERIEKIVRRLKNKFSEKREVLESKNRIIEKYSYDNLVGESRVMQNVYSAMHSAATTNINVSLHGETGTGKGLIAKIIHYNSKRKNKPFIELDLRAIRPENIDKELVGMDSSLTHDGSVKYGLLERANNGTIFLDGFEDLKPQLQYYVQKVLQSNEITREGGIDAIPVDVKIIMSYSGTLSDLMRRQKITESHYYRTMGMPIEVPPLRERGFDSILLANKFIENFVNINGLEPKTLSEEAANKILNNSFLGNILELKAIVELATVRSNGNIIEPEDLNYTSTSNLSDFLFEERTLKEYTSGIVKHYLERYDGNVIYVADKLEIGKSTIYRMIQQGEV